MNKGEIGFVNCFEEKVEIDMGTFLCEIDACLHKNLKLTTTLKALKLLKKKTCKNFEHQSWIIIYKDINIYFEVIYS